MKILQVSAVAFALLGLGSVALAAPFPGGGGPLPSVAKQVRAEAKADGILKGLKSPQFNLDYSKTGKTVRVTVTALSTFNGSPTPLKKAQRMPEYTAKFKVGQVMEGRIATPTKSGGRVWQMMMR